MKAMNVLATKFCVYTILPTKNDTFGQKVAQFNSNKKPLHQFT